MVEVMLKTPGGRLTEMKPVEEKPQGRDGEPNCQCDINGPEGQGGVGDPGDCSEAGASEDQGGAGE